MNEEVPPAEEIESPEETARRQIATTIVKEILILFLGIFIGWIWSTYGREAGEEAHLVIFLTVIIICLVRFIYLLFTIRPAVPEE